MGSAWGVTLNSKLIWMTRYDTEMYTDECTRRNLGMLEQARVCRPLDEVRALVFANHIMNRWKCVLLNMRGGYELCSIFFRFTIQSVKMTNDSWNHFQDKRTHFKLLSNEINQLFSFATISLNLSLSLFLSFKNNSNLVCEVTNNCNYRLSHHQTALIFPPVLRVWKRESIIQKKNQAHYNINSWTSATVQ